MKRFLIAGALAVLPATASAGVGVTWSAGSEYGAKGYYTSAFNLPTIDYHQDKFVIQVHALDLVEGLVTDNLQFGLNGYMTTRRAKVNEDVGGVIQPGLSLDIYAPGFDFSNGLIGFQAQVRMGAQTQKGTGFGIYVVPGLGVGMAGGEADVMVSGMLQVSAWTNK